MNYILRHDYLPIGKARPGTKIESIESITIHWIGPYPNQSVEVPRNWWDTSGLEASAHFIIKDELVLATVPMDEVAWHCGVPKGNATSIGIEVIPEDKNGRFSAASIETLKELLQDIPRVPIKRHYDWTKKDCPLYYTPISFGGEERWQALKKELGYESV